MGSKAGKITIVPAQPGWAFVNDVVERGKVIDIGKHAVIAWQLQHKDAEGIQYVVVQPILIDGTYSGDTPVLLDPYGRIHVGTEWVAQDETEYISVRNGKPIKASAKKAKKGSD